MRVSGGHLCAQHRSTDRGGSRDLEPAASSASPPLAVSKILFGLERRRILTAAPFHTPFIRHWRRSCSMPKASLLCSQIKKAVIFQLLLLFLVEATGLEPAASCSQSKRATKLRHASICNFQLSVVYIKLLFLSTDI